MNNDDMNLDNLKKETEKYERRDFADIKKRVAKAKAKPPEFIPASKRKINWLWVGVNTVIAAAFVLILGITAINTLETHNETIVKAPYYDVYEALREASERQSRLNRVSTEAIVADGMPLEAAGTETFGYSEEQALTDMDNTSDVLADDMSGDTSEAEGEEASGEHGETNVQVEGIDEADIVKNDGECIYTLSNYSAPNYEYKTLLSIVNMGGLRLMSQTEFDTEKDGSIIDMYVKNKRLVLVSRLPREDTSSADSDTIRVDSSITSVRIYDVLNHGDAISFQREFRQEGDYISSRLSGETLYLVTSKSVRHMGIIPLEKVGNYVPRTYDSHSRNHAKEYISVKEQDIFISEENDSTFITASALSIVDYQQVSTKTVLGSYGSLVYCSAGGLYVASGFGSDTEIVRYEIDGNSIEYSARATVEGTVLNQFSMDEHDGYLRVAVTIYNETIDNKLYVLDTGLNKIGETPALAQGETIKSARFIGEMAYIVTFRQTDPLFAIDVSDPYSPTVLGELKIPGFSTYLHPLDENTLIGIGYNADAETGWQTGMKFSLFDVSDPHNPQETSTLILNGSIYSDALYNHKAVTFIRSTGLLVIPYSFYDDFVTVGDQKITSEFSSGAMVLNVSKDGGFSLKGIITDPMFSPHQEGVYTNENRLPMRSTYANELIYTVSSQSIVAVSMSDLSFVLQVDFYETEEYDPPEVIYEAPEVTPSPNPDDYSDLEPFQDYTE